MFAGQIDVYNTQPSLQTMVLIIIVSKWMHSRQLPTNE